MHITSAKVNVADFKTPSQKPVNALQMAALAVTCMSTRGHRLQ